MSAVAVDVAQGGADRTVIACRHGPWFAPLIVNAGKDTPLPSHVAAEVVKIRRDGAVVVVDCTGGYGRGVKERLEDNDIVVRPFVASAKSSATTAIVS